MRTKAALILAHLALVAAVGVADVYSGPDYELRPFYLVPVLSAAWYGGRAVGVVVAIAATASLFLANDYIGAALLKGPTVLLWNSASRITSYLLVALLTAQTRIQSDALRAKTDELIRESALREEYIALFVHELRHSAAAIALAVASLVPSPRLAADERVYLGHLRDQARDLEKVAGQMLAMGPLESGGIALNTVDVDLAQIAREARATSSERERIQLTLPAAPAWTRGDPEQLGRALDNYLRNALKYSPKTSSVTLEVIARDARVGVAVSDRGVGFEPAEAPRLFEKYGRLRNARSTKLEGAGLGLYLTRLIVEAHGGQVEAASAGPGGGSRFGFSLPQR